MKVISADAMREVDKKTIASGISGDTLMERAGKAAAHEIIKFLETLHPNHTHRLVIVCGKGNNAGDGLVIARLLQESYHIQIVALFPLETLKGDALVNFKRLDDNIEISDHLELQRGDVIIDCLLGTGLNSKIREPLSSAVRQINESNLPVISIDISSGLNGNTGEVMGDAVHADLTICIGQPKMGQFHQSGPKYSGQLRCADIGFPQAYIDEIENFEEAIFEVDVAKFFKRRSSSSHKYECGSVVVVGGSPSYMGAAFLSGRAALRSGAGIVRVAIPIQKKQIVARQMDALIIDSFKSSDGYWSKKHYKDLSKLIKEKTVLAVGPGFAGVDSEKELLDDIINYQGPMVIDAGAIGLLNEEHLKLRKRQNVTVLSPHCGEMKSLVKNLKNCPDGSVEEQAAWISSEFQVFLILKGQYSQIFCPDGEMYRNTSGSVALATAGAGDVLTGLIASYLSQLEKSKEAVLAAVFVHGRAGEMSLQGKRGLIADDLIGLIPQALMEITAWA